MGRNKEYRQRLKYQVASAMKKTLTSQLRVELAETLGLSEAESELLAHRLGAWLLRQPDVRSPNQIFIYGAPSSTAYARGKAPSAGKRICITPYDVSDLELELEFGLTPMQLGRVLRMIEEAYAQDSLIDAKQVALLGNMTPTSLRNRLNTLISHGIWVPTRGMPRKMRAQGGMFRSTWLLKTFFAGNDVKSARKLVAISRNQWRTIQDEFASVARQVLTGAALSEARDEFIQWEVLARSLSAEQLNHFSEGAAGDQTGPGRSWEVLRNELEAAYRFSPIRIRAVREILDELISQFHLHQADNEVIYWAVSASEPAGKPLTDCTLVPVPLTLYAPEDQPTGENADGNRLSEIKYGKILRYATQAKVAGGYLNYADLSYLMGIHPEAVRRLVDAEANIIIPLRGNQCDIGRGTTHRRRIIELFLQMYTETEIVSRTGHSYEAVENYIKEFAKVWVLYQRGMAAPLIRKVTRRSMQLVNAYLELAQAYDTPEYAFRFQRLEAIYAQETQYAEKKRGTEW